MEGGLWPSKKRWFIETKCISFVLDTYTQQTLLKTILPTQLAV